MFRQEVVLAICVSLAVFLSGCVATTGHSASAWQAAADPDLSVREMLRRPNTMTWVRAHEVGAKRRVTESIRFGGLEHPADIIFNDCVFTEPVEFISCQLGRVYFRNCEFKQGVSFHGTTFSDRVGFEYCEVRWPEANNADANLDEAISGLDLRSCSINGNLTIFALLNEGFLDLTNLRTSGYVQIRGVSLNTRQLSGSSDATRDHTHTGPILASGAEIGGQLVITGVVVRKSPAHHQALGASPSESLEGQTVVLDDISVGTEIRLGPLTVEGSLSMLWFECGTARLQSVRILGVTNRDKVMHRIRSRDLTLLLPANPGRESASLAMTNGSIDGDLRIENCLVEGHCIILANQVGGDLTIGVVPRADRPMIDLRTLQANIANIPTGNGFSSDQVRDFVGGTLSAFGNRVSGAMVMRNTDVEGGVHAPVNTAQRMSIEGIRVARGVNISNARLDRDFFIRDAVIGRNGDGHSLNMTRANAFEANIMKVDAAGAVLLQDASLELLQVNPDGNNSSTAIALKCTTLDASNADIGEARLAAIQAKEIVLRRAKLGTLIGLKLSRVEALIAPQLLADDVLLGSGLPDSVQLQQAIIGVRLTVLDSTKPEEEQALTITLDGARVSGPVDLKLNRSRETRISMASAALEDRVRLDAMPQADCDEPPSRWIVELTDGQFANDVTISGATLGLVDLTDMRLEGRLRVRRGTLGSIVANGIRGQGVIDLSKQDFDEFKMEGGRAGELFLPGGEASGAIEIRRSNASLLEWALPPGGDSAINLVDSSFGRIAIVNSSHDRERFMPLLERMPKDERMRDNYRTVEQALRRDGLVPESHSVYLAHEERKDHAWWHPILAFYGYGTALGRMFWTLIFMFFGLFLVFNLSRDAAENKESLDTDTRGKSRMPWLVADRAFLAIRHVVPPVSLVGRELRASDRPLMAMWKKDWQRSDSNWFSRQFTFDLLAKTVTVFSWILWPFVIAAIFDLSPSGLYR
ncbi:MAG: pentapeptide repeat-containing protein [Phycisphaerales bacterium]